MISSGFAKTYLAPLYAFSRGIWLYLCTLPSSFRAWSPALSNRPLAPDTPVIPGLSHLEDYLRSLRVTRNRSKNTVRNAKSVVTRFLQFLAEEHSSLDLAQVDANTVLRFLERFHEPVYRYSVISHLRAFFDFLKVPVNPARAIKLPRVNLTAHIKLLEPHELQPLLTVLDQQVAMGAYLREHAIIYLMLYTGMRVDEVLQLQKEDLLATGVIRIRDSKTSTSRLTTIPIGVLASISRYQKAYPHPVNPFVFHADERLSDTRPLSYSALRTAVKELFHMAGIQTSGKLLHALRHTFSRALMDGGFTREEIQPRLGHKSIRTTEIYTRLYEHDLVAKSAQVHAAVSEFLTTAYFSQIPKTTEEAPS